jgi:hypothetical protein
MDGAVLKPGDIAKKAKETQDDRNGEGDFHAIEEEGNGVEGDPRGKSENEEGADARGAEKVAGEKKGGESGDVVGGCEKGENGAGVGDEVNRFGERDEEQQPKGLIAVGRHEAIKSGSVTVGYISGDL